MSDEILPFDGVMPVVGDDVFIAPGAKVIGDVHIGALSSIWYGCILRGDVNEIRIGARTNIQDGTVIHVASKGQGTYIGDDVAVGHMALLHACTIEDRAFVGMKAVVMDGAVVETGGMVAAGALITPGKRVKTGELWTGWPAKLTRALTEKDQAMMTWTQSHYVGLAQKHKASQ
jgi:carbonic anhydrase/acetyltransferase-like protein (isoleucine patch superfamily)